MPSLAVTYLILCLAAHRARGKSLFDYNVNPEYDLLAEESRSYSNVWPGSELYSPTHRRFKHFAKPGYGGTYEISGYGGHPSHSFGYSNHHHQHHHFPQSSEDYGEDSGISYDYPQHHQHPHEFSSGQANNHGFNGLHPHGVNRHPHDPPRRFPPPPVYDKDFINPWALPTTSHRPFIKQQPPLTTPAVYIAPKLTTRTTTPPVYLAPKLTTRTTTPAVYIAPKLTTRTTTPAVYIAPKLTTRTTTPSPITSTPSDDVYDIDVRFGRD